MSTAIAQYSETKFDTQAIDALVGSYAAIGAAETTRRRRRNLAMAALAGSLVVAIGVGIRTEWTPILFGAIDQAALAGIQASVRTRVDDELGAIGRERAMLQAQQLELEAKLDQVTAQLAEFEQRSSAWEEQGMRLAVQSAALDAAIMALEDERESFEALLAGRPSLDEEMRGITAEREELDRRWQDFVAEDRAIDTELESLRAQRSTVEAQRAELERQKAELESLLFGGDETEATADDSTGLQSTTPSTSGGNRAGYEITPERIAAIIDENQLDDMRAGFQLGNGMTVSLGLTRTASIDGVEQFVNTIDVGAIGFGIGSNSLAPAGSFVLQNGDGNFIGDRALDTLSAGFGSVIQNTLDDQTIRTETIYDLGIEGVSQSIGGLAGGQALGDSLRFLQ